MYSYAQAQEVQSATKGYFHTSDEEAIHDFQRAHRIMLPTQWEICRACHGDGGVPFGGGIVLSEEDTMDPEFMEDYFAGHYDKDCTDCKGSGKVKVPDFKRMSDEVQAKFEKYLKDVRSANAESLAERRMGC